MPTLDRKPRARRRPEEAVDDHQAMHRLMREAGGNAARWEEIRPRVMRALLAGGRLTAEQAAAIFNAYRKRPELLPRV